MAKLRSVNTHFWTDGYVVDLDPLEKLLFLYFLTNPLTTIAGAYEIPLRQIAYDTGIDKEMVVKMLARFEVAGRIVYKDGWIVMPKFLKNQHLNTNMIKGVIACLNDAPKWVADMVRKALKGSQRLSKAFEPFDNLNLNTKEESERESEVKVETPQAAPTKKGTRIAEPFILTAEMKQYAAEKRPEVDPILETEKFVNYWRAKTGKDATKLDWTATWRNWILNARSNGNGKPQRFEPGKYDPAKFPDVEVLDVPDIPPCSVCGKEYCFKHLPTAEEVGHGKK